MTDISRHIISQEATLREAMMRLNRLSGDAMTLFVTDSQGIMRGTLTDGDIRRALIAGSDTEAPAGSAMFTRFLSLSTGEQPAEKIALARCRGINLLPRLDSRGCVSDVVDIRKVRCALPLDAVLMAGGRGERLRPLTLDTPKPLLKIGGVPIIDRNIDALCNVGIESIFVTVNYLGSQIEEHFSHPRFGGRVKCVREPARLGTIGSLALVEGITQDNLLLMNSDILTTLDFEAMYARHAGSGADLTIAAVPYSVSVPFAIMRLNGDRVAALEEKPTYNYLANAGVYMMKSRLRERIAPGKPLDAPDFIGQLIADGLKVGFFPIDGTWIDIGSPDDFRCADELMSRTNNP